MRNHRKRFVRKFAVTEDLDPEEQDKFTSGEDGALIKVPRQDCIKAIENPQLDTAVNYRSLFLTLTKLQELLVRIVAHRIEQRRQNLKELQ